MMPPRSGSGRTYAPDQGGWLLGPTWLYVVLAAAIFVAAAVVAVVQATGSDDPIEPAGAEAVASAPQESAPQVDDRVVVVTEPEQQSTPPPSSEEQQQQQAAVPEAQAEVGAPDEEDQTETAIQQQDASGAQQNPLTGFIVPIRGACITEHEGHLPTAAREYRNNGVHEGLDFYQWAACTAVDFGTEILAAKAGVVVRADLDYVDITPADWDRFVAANWEGDTILDELRGRQVWIDHGRGIVTRYAHLSVIAEGIAKGVEVQRGQLIGYPGESGQQEVYQPNVNDVHLHFEIRIGEGWLGQGTTPREARLLYLEAFGISSP